MSKGRKNIMKVTGESQKRKLVKVRSLEVRVKEMPPA